MTKIQAATAATKELEQAIQRFSDITERLNAAERSLTDKRSEYEKAVSLFDDSDKARQRVRLASDEVEMAKAIVGKLQREAKTKSVDLIEPTRIARDRVTEAIKEARETYFDRVVATVRPLFDCEDFARRAAIEIYPRTKGGQLIKAGPEVVHCPDGIDVLARAILSVSKNSLANLALV